MKRFAAAAAVASLALAACGGDDDSAEDDVSAAAEDVSSAAEEMSEAESAAEESVSEAASSAEEEMSEAESSAESEMSEEMSEETGGADLASMSGTIDISGSSTVEPISVRVQELFNEQAGDVNITVDGPGTGDGFQLFCTGETDISDASRAISEEEVAMCEENGVEYTELQVGIDGMALMTHTGNDAVECLTFEQVYGLVGPESTGFETWADANDLITEIGGEGNLPDAPLDIYGPGEESGTYDSFVEIVIEDIAEERGQEAETRVDYNPSADDNVILQGIQGGDTTFGWVGFAFAANAEGVTLIQADGGDGCVEATPETIADNSYPISRPLFIYVNNGKAAENEALTAFVDFYLQEGLDTAAAEVGYVALADDVKEEVRSAWESGQG